MADPVPTFEASLTTDEATARRIGDAVAELYDASEVATAAFEDTDGKASPPSWTVKLYFGEAPDEDGVRAMIAAIVGEAPPVIRFTRLTEKDWVRASLEGLIPVAAGRFLVHGSHDRARVSSNRIGIEIEAALAFGTGHHGTTRGCLLALDAIAKARRPRCILDIGTGSGVLAIAAAKALRAPVLASDIDRDSVAIARENMRINRAPDVQVITAAGIGAHIFRAHAPFDLVFANILLAPLKTLAKPMRRLLAPGATVILSGLLARQANAAAAAYRAHGLILERRIVLEGWATLILRAPAFSRTVRRIAARRLRG
jgi:ribosomal protein L11 methyltransferase